MKPLTTPAVRFLLVIIFAFQIGRADANVTVDIQPGSRTIPVGTTAIFGAVVVASGGETVTGYQWFMSPNSTGPYVTVGEQASLVISNADIPNSGYYFVTVTYQSGTAKQTLSSSTITLTVDPKPGIVIQPADVTNPPGSNAVFSVMAGGEPPLNYQWRHDGANLSDNSRITGSHQADLEIQNLADPDGGGYDVVIANSYGSITSQVANLTVGWIPPAITSATNVLGQQGHTPDYAITASGTPPMTFGATGLPADLAVDPATGAFTGIPQVAGVFDITLYATNGGYTTTTNLELTLVDDIPVITSDTNATGKQGYFFTYSITASNDPAWFDAGPLPTGLSLNHASGVISGIPLVSNTFLITIDTTNAYGADTQTLTLNLESGAALITSPLTASGKQGQPFNYTIVATNNPATYSAASLPAGLNLDPVTGVISGIPLVNGAIPVTVGSANEFGSDSQTLTMNLSSAVPSITSSLTAVGHEQGNFSYTIRANNSPSNFWAMDLPMGLTVDPNTGKITGIPIYAGNYTVPIFAANQWGVGTTNLQLNVNNLSIGGLVITTNIMTNYFSPYLLEFTFQLRDGPDPLTSHAVVASPSLMTFTAFEDGTPVDPLETGVYLRRAASKVLKGYLVLDFTASVASMSNGDANGNGISDAVDAEVAAAQSFVNEQPADSQIGVYEFHRDDEAPQQVLPLTTDKTLLTNAIAGIWTNYVQGFPAGSRAWDALGAAIKALGSANTDENHYIVFMSDGGDDSSTTTLDNVITAANAGNVQIFTVGFGDQLDGATLDAIATQTVGAYFPANNLSALALSFAVIGKDLSSQYVLRWATLKRSSTYFIPSFQITYQGQVAQSPAPPPPIPTGTNITYTTNMTGDIVTNMDIVYTTNYYTPPYQPTAHAGNVLAGGLRLVPNAATNPTAIDLRATYVPRYIGQLHLHYRANWPVSVTLNNTNSGRILDGWSMTQTNDGAGGDWLTLSSPDPSNPLYSIPFATFGKLLTFSFHDPINASNAFSLFQVDNTIYTNTTGTNFYGFVVTNATSFIKSNAPPLPHGTPIPWLISHGFTNDFTNAELVNTNGNGFAVWQDYLAGLDPRDSNATFEVQVAGSQNPPQITFNTVVGRTYRIEWSLGLNGPWTLLRDGFAGTGGDITYTDYRDLSTVDTLFYRVGADGPGVDGP